MYNSYLKQILNEKDFNNLINSDFCKSSFSQFGEDLIINKIFKKIHNGNYLDLGSFHPIHFSNTFLLYLRGWRGVNIDGNEDMIEISKKIRPLDKNIFAHLSNKEKECFYIINKKNPAMNKITDNANSIRDNEKFIKIKTKTLDTLIGTHDQYLEKLYYLNVDLEFIDKLIIKEFNFSKFRPLLITIEIHDFELDKDNEISNFLKENNYYFHSFLNPTAFFIDKKFKKNKFNLL